MLQTRARAFALRDAFPDVLGGLYLTEEFVGSAEESEDAGPSQNRSQNQHQAYNSDTNTAFRKVFAGEDSSKVGNEDHNAGDENIGAGSWKTTSQDGETVGKGRGNTADEDYAGVESRARKALDGDANLVREENKVLEEFADGAERGARDHAAAPAYSLEKTASSALKVTDHLADKAIKDERAPLTAAPLLPLANLRRARHMPRHIRALHFRNQWSVKQPKSRLMLILALVQSNEVKPISLRKRITP
jgi:hypothetical protein